ncbi:MAG: cytochrome c family protein [Planctomycetota bacterium]|jgi:formate-dependent nitrite reductase cytochrome c552 subunit
MKLRFTMVAVLVLCGIGLWVRGGASPAAAVAASDDAQPPAGTAEYEYVGTKKCKSCHLDVHKSWEKTKMGMAFETLKPGHAKEAKDKFGFDANKDYTADAKCLPCHTTGYGKPGGYVIPAADDKRAARKMKNLQNVGCESSHGPGSGYVKVFEEIDKSQRKYTLDELYSVGLHKAEKAMCVSCHNDKSPTFNADDPFDYDKVMAEDKAKTKGEASFTHAHKPLKLREG